MRGWLGASWMAFVLVSSLIPGARDARAATYQILSGSVSGPGADLPQALAGHFDTVTVQNAGSFRTFLVDDFTFQAGNRVFTPAAPIEFEGMTPIGFAQPAEQIALYENQVVYAWFRSGAEVTASSAAEVTFHFLEFRGTGNAGLAAGLLDDGVHPRRFSLEGTLYDVEQRFEIRRSRCSSLPLPVRRSAAQPADVGLVIIPIEPIPLPCGLYPIGPAAEQSVGPFRLVATAARPIPIDVRPGQTNNAVRPGSAGNVQVAILAARPLDVCPIDERSLRLGDGEAEPIPWSAGELTRERDVDGDGAPDLLARFRVRDIGVAFGDDSICLVAETTWPCVETLEGCDAIQTLPGR